MSTLRSFVVGILAGVVWGSALLATVAVAAEPSPGQVWLASTRELGDVDGAAAAHVPFWRLGADCQWRPADEAAFLASDAAAVPTVVYVHGNRTNAHEAVQVGWDVYTTLGQACGGRPFRFLIWSWPSDRLCGGNRLDVQVKAVRSELESYYLAAVLAKIQPKVPVSLIGYSFGARTIGGALHLMAGGEYSGRRLPAPAPSRSPIRAVFVAAAIDCDAMGPQGAAAQAATLAGGILVAYNPADPVLRWYPRLWSCRGPQALGYLGPDCCPGADRLVQLNLMCEVGREHAWECYWRAPSLHARLPCFALFVD